MNEATFRAFADEMTKIAEAEAMDKEAFVQYLYGAGRALGAMGSAGARMAQTGWQAGQKAMQAGGGFGQALQKGWQAAAGKGGVGGQLARGAQRGWRTGVGRMEQLASTQGSWLGKQQAMGKAMLPGSVKAGPSGVQQFAQQQRQARFAQPRGFAT